MNKYREGKVKSTPVRGVKEYLKPRVYKQSKHYARKGTCDGVPFASWACELPYVARLSREVEPKGNRVLTRANEWHGTDPKPSDLSLSRLKRG